MPSSTKPLKLVKMRVLATVSVLKKKNRTRQLPATDAIAEQSHQQIGTHHQADRAQRDEQPACVLIVEAGPAAP